MVNKSEIPKQTLQTGLAVFRKAVNSVHVLADSDLERIEQVLHYKKYSKGAVILQEGKVCRKFWFILKGCFRIFSLENGSEVNVQFFLERRIATDFISLRHQTPSRFFITALEDTEVLYSSKPEYLPVLNFSKAMVKLTAAFFATHFLNEVEHANSFKMLTPEQRYKNLLSTTPDYIQRIPLTYLASYLGMSRKTLTRIRQSIK